MQVITIESEAFQNLVAQISEIKEKLNNQQEATPLSENWLDNQDVCQLLHISKRTLQHYRDNGLLPFSQIGAKIYYKASDIEDFLQQHYQRGSGGDRQAR